MNRNEWTFEYDVGPLYDAADKKLKHHTARLKWWKNKQADVMKNIKKSGLRIDDSLVMEYGKTGYASNAGRSPSVHIETKLLADMNECTGKISEHTAHVKVYESWVRVLSEATGTRDLHYDDWLFFFSEK